jgi:apolipoprotein N-acyltransferase
VKFAVSKSDVVTFSLLVAAALSTISSLLFEVPFVAWGGPLFFVWALERRPAHSTALIFCALFCGTHFSFLPRAALNYFGLPLWLGWGAFMLVSPLLEPQFVVYALIRNASLGFNNRPARVLFAIAAFFLTERWWPKLLGDTWAYSLYPDSVIRQNASLIGAHGLTLFMLLVSELLVVNRPLFWHATTRIVGLGLFVLLRLTGTAAPAALASETMTVIAVQGALDSYPSLIEKSGTFGLLTEVVDRYVSLTHAKARGEAVDLIVWPETVYPASLGQLKSDAQAQFDAQVFELSRSFHAPLLLGTYERGATETSAEYNVAALVEKGELRSRYRKSLLFPLSETVPFAALFRALHVLPASYGWEPGDGPQTLSLDNGMTIQPFICYESTSQHFSRNSEAALLVNLTNDDWFESDVQRKWHLWVSAFRSIEARRPQARVTNGGVTAAIDQFGTVMRRLDSKEQGALRMQFQITRNAGPTVAAGFDAVAPTCAVVVCVAVLARSTLLRRRQ